ncbi:hypothetical protein MJL81_30210, partial [Salmonella enterica subsp. enterica serovar Anatum]|nr:hypothetical protein [Salmonella enterica subsp. enterica serovar Anatum]
MCGSGTLLIEAAMWATDRAPGLHRGHWGFSGWAQHDEAIWQDKKPTLYFLAIASSEPPSSSTTWNLFSPTSRLPGGGRGHVFAC